MAKLAIDKTEKQAEKKILGLLEEIGGKSLGDESIAQQGEKLVLPENMSVKQAIGYLERYNETQEEVTEISRTFKYRPWDGAAALQRALKKLIGTTGIPKSTFSFFGENKPELRTINTDVGETLQVPWGTFQLPMLKAEIYTSGYHDAELGMLFAVVVEAPRKYASQVEGLFKLIDQELSDGSIYRGKAFDGRTMPEFLDLSKVDPESAVYAEDTAMDLEASLWSLLRYSQTMRTNGVPLKRAVLLEGPWGSGKTLAAFVTATIAKANGWTFLYCRPGQDDIYDVMATARLYQPAVVFFEDMDVIADDPESNHLTRLLDLFDGITAKGTELICVLTTNHKEKISKALVRPGRLDAIIHIGAQDRGSIEKMVRYAVHENLLDSQIDFDKIGEAMEGFLPVFVNEAIQRTVRYGIVRANGKTPETLTTDDFVSAAKGLRTHLALMEAEVPEKPESLYEAIGTAVKEHVTGLQVEFGPELSGAKATITNGNGS